MQGVGERTKGIVRASLAVTVWIMGGALPAVAAPEPIPPAIATVVDPQRFPSAFMREGKPIAPFVPVAITGRGFGSNDTALGVRILTSDCEWEMHTLTPRQDDRCSDSKPLPCVVMWTDERVVLKLAPAMANVALQFAAGGQCLPVEHYRYDWFASDAAGDHRGGVPLALALDARRHLWLNEEFHRDLKHLPPSSRDIRAIPIPTAKVPAFATNLFARDSKTHSSMLGEDVVVDPDGRIWLSEGGASLYGIIFEGNNPNHSRIIAYDPRNQETRVYNIPGNGNEITGLAFDQRCTDGTSTGSRCVDAATCLAGQSCGRRMWFTENARRKAKFFLETVPGFCDSLCTPITNHLARELIPPRLAWFSIEPGATPYTTNGAASFEPGVCAIEARTCANRTCTRAEQCQAACAAGTCADGSGRSCAAAGDCAGTCVEGLCANWTCQSDGDCDSGCVEGRCTDNTGRMCTATSSTDCDGICFARGKCTQTKRACLSNDDCALERSVCDWNDPRRDCHFREYRLPGASIAEPRGLGFFFAAHVLVGRDGAMWYTAYGGGNHVGRLMPEACDPLKPDACTVQVFPLSTPRGKNPAAAFVGSGPWEIVEADDGDIVFSEFFDNTIGRLHTVRLNDPRYDCSQLNASGLNPCVSEADIPVSDSAAVQTHSVTRGADGTFWFTESTDMCFQSDRGAESSIGYVRYPTPQSPQVTLFPPLSLYDFKTARSPCRPDTFRAFVGTGIVVDPTSGDIWFGDMLRRRIGRMRRVQ